MHRSASLAKGEPFLGEHRLCGQSRQSSRRNFRTKNSKQRRVAINDGQLSDCMKSKILFVANDDADLEAIVTEAARKTGRGIRKASSSRQTFEILNLGLEDVDLAIVDLDPSLHSLAILEALDYSQAAPPVIALTKLDEAEVGPIARRHGATTCLRKPFAADELAILIEKVCESIREAEPLSCDQWGHPRASRRHASTPGIAHNNKHKSDLHPALE